MNLNMSKKVLIVDDDQNIPDVITQILDDEGYTAREDMAERI